MKKIVMLPAMLTLGNAACGFTAIATIINGAFECHGDISDPALMDRLWFAGLMIFVAMICDALDGLVARLVRGTSTFGGHLDSLADIISFGVAPALMVIMLAQHTAHPPLAGGGGQLWLRLVWIITGLYCLCAILRLARYNDEHASSEERTDYFEGMPIPGAAGMIAAVVMLYAQEASIRTELLYVMIVAMPLLAGLMVSRLPFPHFVNKVLLSRHSLFYIIAFAMAVLVVIITGVQIYALAGGFLFYTALGMPLAAFRHISNRRHPERAQAEGFSESDDD